MVSLKAECAQTKFKKKILLLINLRTFDGIPRGMQVEVIKVSIKHEIADEYFRLARRVEF